MTFRRARSCVAGTATSNTYRRSTGSRCNFEGSYAILAIWPHTLSPRTGRSSR